MDTYYLLLALLTLLLASFFYGMETAFLASNKLQIELQKKQGKLSGKILSIFLKQPDQFRGTTLFGASLMLVAFVLFFSLSLDQYLENVIPEVPGRESLFLVSKIFLGIGIAVVFLDLVIKRLFVLHANRLITFFAFPFLLVFGLFYPIVGCLVILFRESITRVLRLDFIEEKPHFSQTELRTYIKEQFRQYRGSATMEIDSKIFANAIQFKTVRVRDCMVPRTDIVAVALEDSVASLRKVFEESGHSKIIIYRDSIDEVIGYCHHLELFKKPKAIADILTTIIITSESALANELLIQFIQERKSLALVVDEFGGTSGIIAMEDIIEEIFGEIEDEYDHEDLTEQVIGEHEYLMSARLEIDYLNEKYGWDLPTGDYETLSGLVLLHTENLPNIGETVTCGRFTFTIVSKLAHRMETLRLKIKDTSIR
ncbi:MAG: hemolysin family protein [Bacteroidota bacterium]|jgi:putative hemolysin